MSKRAFNPDAIFRTLEVNVAKSANAKLAKASTIAKAAADAEADKMFSFVVEKIQRQDFSPLLIGTPYWPTSKPLSPKWIKRKRNDNFFIGTTGKLLGSLARQEATALYGAAVVKKRRDAKGSVLDHGQFSLTVFPKMRISQYGRSQQLPEDFLPDLDRRKLVGKASYHRALLMPVLRWWMKRRIPQAIKRALQAKGYTVS